MDKKFENIVIHPASTQNTFLHAIVATADDHISFLRSVVEIADKLKPDESLYSAMAKEFAVNGKSFSQAGHLTKLEEYSDTWDLPIAHKDDKTALHDSKKVEMVQLTRSIMAKEPGYDLAHFTEGYQAMLEDLNERKVDLEAKPAPAPVIQSGLLKMLSEPVSGGKSPKSHP